MFSVVAQVRGHCDKFSRVILKLLPVCYRLDLVDVRVPYSGGGSLICDSLLGKSRVQVVTCQCERYSILFAVVCRM